MGYGEVPYGINAIKVVPMGTAQTPVELPIAQKLTFKETIEAASLKGNGMVKAAVAHFQGLEWSLEAGGISLAALAVMTGRTATTTGVTPARVTTAKASGGGNFPYFKIYGKSLGDSTDDIHCIIYKAKITALEGNMEDGAFMITKCSGIAVDDGTNGVYDFIQNETAAELPTS